MKIWERISKFHKSNRGSGIVMVLITVGFLGILSGMLMFISYGGYKMKLVDKKNKDTFYTVETVLDVVNLKIQQSVSLALETAYQDVMDNYAIYDNPGKRNNMFYENYYKKLKQELTDNVATSQGSIQKLRDFVIETTPELKGDGDLTPGHFASNGAIIEGATSPDFYDIEINMDEGEELVIKGLKVSYVNESGNVAMIQTDIRIAMPRMNFTDSSALPDLDNFVAISDGHCLVENLGNSNVTVKGNFYANDLMAKHTAGGVEPVITFMPSESIDPSEPVTPDPDANVDNGLVVFKEDVNVEKGNMKIKNMDVWVRNFVFNEAKADIDGSLYVKNDLELKGKKSDVKLAGSYTGYGNSKADSKESSAILINGRESNLDLSGLKVMNILGRGFIGTKYQTGESFNTELDKAGKETEKNNGNDIKMGESVTVKSNQLAYLVPTEAIGCTNNHGLIGESTVKTNPMPYSEYERIKNNPQDYVLVNSLQPLSALGGKKLEDYMSGNSPEIVFKTTVTEPLVYFYMNFKNAEAANQFFKDYYGINAQKVDQFAKLYANKLVLASPEQLNKVSLAGNIVEYTNKNSAGELNEAQGSQDSMEKMRMELTHSFKALTTKLVPSLKQLNGKELDATRSVFKNIINVEKLNDVLSKEGSSKLILSTNGKADGKKVLFTNLPYNVDGTSDVELVVSTKNVTVDESYTGLVIAGGDLIISGNANPIELNTLSMSELGSLMLAKEKEGEAKYYALDFFRDGINYENSENRKMDYGTESVSVADLIMFENWSKK